MIDKNQIDADESDYLYIQESQLENSGNGLFTAIDIFKDEIIAVFKGEILSDEEAERRANSRDDAYFMNLLNGKILDCKNTNCFAKYANDGSGFSKSDFKNNAKITLDENENVCLVALKKIKSGEEVFCDYGAKYWNKHKFHMKKIIILLLIMILNISCQMFDNRNHIEKYDVNIDSLKTLPNNLYAYRRGNIYIEDNKFEKFRVWFSLNNSGSIENIFKIENFSDKMETVINLYNIDTVYLKKIGNKFIHLSKKYNFGHIMIDKSNKIYFSYKDGLSQQYVKTFNDSLKMEYSKNKDFKLLKNGWFENKEK